MTTPTAPLGNRVALVTGANTGIGRITALELARMGARVFLACRSLDKARPVLEEIRAQTSDDRADLLALDLSDLESVRACARGFLARDLPLHLLINNGGVAGQRGFTKSGFELAFGVNHVGHFLLTQLLLDKLRATAADAQRLGASGAGARVVTVASRAHYRAPGIDFDAVRKRTASITGVPEYGVSKLANVLFSAELARRVQGSGVHTYSLHPGVVATDVWRRIPGPVSAIMKLGMIAPEDGARTTLYCATSDACAHETGLYYDKCAARPPSAVAQDEALAKRLWEQSEAWCSAS